jgi:hypothetical protein
LASKTGICSNALLLIGSQTINDLEEGTDRARTAANLYPFVFERVLREHSWNCAKRRVILAPMVAAPVFDWKYQFALPGDWIRNIQIGYDRDGSNGAQGSWAWIAGEHYIMEGRRILTNFDTLPLVYISNLTTEAEFDASLTYTMTVAMAAAMAYPITKSSSVQQTMEQLLAETLRKARNYDGQDDPPQTLGDSPMYQARFGTFPLIPGRS